MGTFDLDKIIASKRAMRARLAALPIEEKLRMLDELQERTLAIKAARRDPARPAREVGRCTDE